MEHLLALMLPVALMPAFLYFLTCAAQANDAYQERLWYV